MPSDKHKYILSTIGSCFNQFLSFVSRNTKLFQARNHENPKILLVRLFKLFDGSALVQCEHNSQDLARQKWTGRESRWKSQYSTQPHSNPRPLRCERSDLPADLPARFWLIQLARTYESTSRNLSPMGPLRFSLEKLIQSNFTKF